MPLTTVTLNSPVASAFNWTVPANVYRVNVFLVGGGGGGGSGGSSAGGGGGGGRVLYTENVSVTPGSAISCTIGAGSTGTGGTTTFGALSVTGGGAGISNGAAGGASSKTILGTTTNYGQSGSGGAGSDGDGVGITGGQGYNYTLTGQFYGGGGGGGAASFGSGTARPILGGLGGRGGGGQGGGEGQAGAQGTDGIGGGGGGGSASGTATTYTQLSGANSWSTSINGVAATAGARGGNGVIIISYDTSTFNLTSDKPGVGEGDTITFTLRTTGVANGVSIPYNISGTNVTGTDFTSGSNSGNFVITSTDGGATGTATLTLTLTSTAFTEGEETATLTAGTASLTFKIGDAFLTTIASPESLTISQQHYNAIRNPLVAVMGTGSSDSGWNMTIRSSSVAEGNRVTATQWSNLRFDIINAWTHLYGSAPSLVEALEGNRIRANNTNSPYLQYQGFVNNIAANKLGPPHATQSVTRSANPSNPSDVWLRETTWPHPIYGASWTTRLTATVSATWSNASAARYFFNTGGEIRFVVSRTGGTATAQGNSWTNLLNSAGVIGFGGGKPEQGTSPSNGLNYYRLTNNYQVFFIKETTTPYSNNFFRIYARSPNYTSNVQGLDFTVDFFLEWVDNYTALGGLTEGGTNGTMRYSVSTLEAFQVLQPTGAGNLTVQTPTFTLGNIVPS